MFNVQLDNQPEKFLRKADRILKERLCNKIDNLRKDPIPRDAKRVVGRQEKTYRVRVGNYRILYIIYFKDNTILISKIDKRPRAYQ